MLHGNEQLMLCQNYVGYFLSVSIFNRASLGHIYSYPNKKQSYYYITIEAETQVGNFRKVTLYKSRADIQTHICLTLKPRVHP